MTPERLELLRKIESFDIDGGACGLPFAARLARERGWSLHHAERVVREYKRYVFLAMCSEMPRCPSEDVDAAWHLHLTYTRSYWKRFCGELLGTPLHHEPTRGGPAEADKHLAMYDATLAAYCEAFGRKPPADIWPSAAQRFGDDLRQRMVNTARNWVVPKQAVKQSLQVAAAFAAIAVFVPGCEGGINPFELKGTDFFYFLIPAMIGAICLGRVIRTAMQRPGPRPGDDAVNLTWEQAAYLAGGYPRLTTAAIARLAEAKIVRVLDDRLEAGKVVPQDRSPVENVVIGQLPISKTQLKSLNDAVEARFGNQAAKLEEDGFAIAKPKRFLGNIASLMPLAVVVLLIGVPRLLMGFMNHKPIEFLLIALIAGSIIGTAVCLIGARSRSQRGEYVLDQHRKRSASHKSDAGMAVALFGTAILAGTAVAYLNDWYPRPTASGADGGCGSGCGTSSDSGGSGCSSGDGGGGGCGGCGGGGGD
jgi:uncharacterized protein (TIGR04222 family)